MYETVKEHHDELYNKLATLIENVLAKAGQGGGGAAHAIQWPPVPLPGPYGNWSDVREGYSHRFKSKMPVDMHDLYGEQGFDQNAARYEIACLQLHNLETLELMDRKDRELQTVNLEVEDLRNQMRQTLLVQDELFKQYFDEKAKFEEKIKHFTLENNDLHDKNAESEHKAKLLEDLVK